MILGFERKMRAAWGRGFWLRALLPAAMACAVVFFFSAGAVAQEATTLVVLRAVPAKSKKNEHTDALPPVVKSDIAEIKIGGKPATIEGLTPLLNGKYQLQLVVLLDSMENIGVSGQFDDIKQFFGDLPPNVTIAVGYLLQGKAVITQPFTTDRTLAGKALHLEPDANMSKNDNGSPYACLDNLATHWPDPDPTKLRAVLMFTDGIDRYNNFQGSDQLNPDIEQSSQYLMKSGIMPFPFYYMDPVPPAGRNEGGALEGQTNFDELVDGSSGYAIYTGQFAPTSFGPLLQMFYGILNSDVVATLTTEKAKGFKPLDIKSSREDIKVEGPEYVTVGNEAMKK